MTQLHGRVNGDLEEGLHQGLTFPDCCCQCPHPVVSPCRPTPPQETPQHQQVVLVQSPVRSLLLSSESWCVQGCVCACQDWRFSFPQSCRSLVIKSQWLSRSDFQGFPVPLSDPHRRLNQNYLLVLEGSAGSHFRDGALAAAIQEGLS